MSEVKLPPLKRIAAVHDLSGLGKCSLTVALPVISATGVECACLPTALLSTHTGEFTGWTLRDLSEEMLPIAHHWKQTGARFVKDGRTYFIKRKDQIPQARKADINTR